MVEFRRTPDTGIKVMDEVHRKGMMVDEKSSDEAVS